ncbi:MAG: hypothetical protein J5616_08365 [Bacteroidaceae bacterium]|nr:hypothetical protein [Bacteroidaceae bacterium]
MTLSPKRFHFPSCGKAHGGKVDIGEVDEKPTKFGEHVGMWLAIIVGV